MLIFLLPLLGLEFARSSSAEIRSWFSRPILMLVAGAGLRYVDVWPVGTQLNRRDFPFPFFPSWGVSLSLWVLALQYTTTVRASLFTALSPLVIIAYEYSTGGKVRRMELYGVGVAMFGAALCVLVSMEEGSDDAQKTASGMAFGDLLCFISSVFTSADFVYTARARQVMPLVTFTTLCTTIVTIVCAWFSVMFEHASLGIATTGLLGWMQPEFAAYVLTLSLIIGVFGVLGYNIALKHISPLILSIVGLTEPVMTGVISWAVGLEGIPALSTWVGGSFVLLGTSIAVLAGDGEHSHH